MEKIRLTGCRRRIWGSHVKGGPFADLLTRLAHPWRSKGKYAFLVIERTEVRADLRHVQVLMPLSLNNRIR